MRADTRYTVTRAMYKQKAILPADKMDWNDYDYERVSLCATYQPRSGKAM